MVEMGRRGELYAGSNTVCKQRYSPVFTLQTFGGMLGGTSKGATNMQQAKSLQNKTDV
jgi:hypothetical protein